MFITSFGEQNITYKCCSNFLIHLCSSPVEVPEMQIAAKRIITKLSADREQFIGLLKSVGEDTSNISSASEV
ncbi:hypothetical protein GPS47_14535 [Acinetobacter haemolyticus]|nr:hypothetical protein [Acinetobacter haemolyticus]